MEARGGGRGELGPVGDVLQGLLVRLKLERFADRTQAVGERRRVLALAHHPEQERERLRRSDLPMARMTNAPNRLIFDQRSERDTARWSPISPSA